MTALSNQARSNHARFFALAMGTAVAAFAALGCGATGGIRTAADRDPPPLPEPLGAFGSTFLGGATYALGGHLGPPHGFSTASESGAFRRLELASGNAWEDLGTLSPALESVGLANHGGLIYRTGGLRVDNAPGQPADLHSVKTVQVYDPAPGRWSDVTPMPEGRSAHGTVVIRDRLYIVAGWELDGDLFSGKFNTGGFVLDLSRTDAAWQPIPPPPFKLRSLSVAAVGDAIYAIGGATDVPGEFSDDVYVLDTRSGTWSKGPNLPTRSSIAGFGAASCSIGDRLYVNDADGLYRLAARGDGWELVAPMKVPRVFNALVCVSDGELLAVGGFDVTRGLSSTADVEAITVSPPAQ
jgi:Kelch motif